MTTVITHRTQPLRIVTQRAFYGWCACLETSEEPFGCGDTEDEAIADLLEQLDE